MWEGYDVGGWSCASLCHNVQSVEGQDRLAYMDLIMLALWTCCFNIAVWTLGALWRATRVVSFVELITFEILAAERLRLMEFDNRLIIDCFANVVNILIWQFSTNDRFKSEKYESLLGKSISRNELYWALFDKYFWLIVIMWRNRLIPINCNYFCWPSDYD